LFGILHRLLRVRKTKRHPARHENMDITSEQQRTVRDSPANPQGSSLSRQLYFVLCLVALAYALLAGLRTVTDWDLGWQLATGRWIVQHHQIPSIDVLSYTAPGQPWIYPVGSGIIFYAVYQIGNWVLLSWLGAAVCVGTVALLLRRGSAVSAALAILAVPRIALRSTPRAEVFTMLLLAAFLTLLWQHYETGRARLWLLPLLMVAWVNLHPGYVVGLAMLAGYVVLEALDMLWPKRRAAAQEHLARAWPWLLATLAATLVNPWGWKIHSWALDFLAPVASQSQWIAEWAAPTLNWRTVVGGLSFTSPNYFVLLLLVVVIAIPAALLQRRLGAAVLLAGATYFGIRHLRLQALFSVMVVVIAGAVLTPALRWLGSKLDGRIRSILSVGACGFLTILVCVWSSGLITNRVYLGETDIASFGTGLGWWFPEGAAAFLERENIPGQIFNSYSEGGFIAWRLGTKYRDYIDGRGAPFGKDLLDRSIRLMGSSPDSPELQQEAERYDINAIILPLGRYQALEQFAYFPGFCASSSWRPVYLDETSVVFMRRQPETESLIQRLEIDCRTSPVPAVAPTGNDGHAFNQWANAAAVLKVLGRDAEAFAATGKALTIFPNSAYVHYTRAELLARTGNLRDAEAEYLSAAYLDQANGASWAKLAKMYEQEGRLNDTIRAWEHLVDIAPDPVDLLSLGYYYVSANRPEDALRAFDRTLKLLPAQSAQDTSILSNVARGRAMSWKALGDYKQAVAFQEETVRLAPDRPADWLELAALYDREGRSGDAQRARERASRLGGGADANPQ
jgi:hypothetical protein